MAQHMLISYALVSGGLKISKPFIQTQYFPLEFEKYILVNSGGRAAGKLYPLYNDVIKILGSILDKNNIKIVQIGSPEDIAIGGILDLRGKTNIHQSSFLIQNCQLLLSNDTSCMHIASGFDKKLVAIFGTTQPENHGAFFGNKNNQINLVSHRNGNKPSFSADESPRTISFVKVEEVAAAVLKLLEIDEKITQKTLYAGSHYCFGQSEIHVIPDQVLNPNFCPPEVIPHLRSDLFFEPNNVFQNLSQRKFILHLNRILDSQQLEILGKLKPNIAAAIVEIFDDTDPNFIKSLQKLGVSINLWTQMEISEHTKIKLDFLDLPLIVRCEDTKKSEVLEKIKVYNNWKSFDEVEKISENIFYYSKAHYLASGKIYNSLYGFRNGISVDNIEQKSRGKLFDQSFMDEFEKFLIQISPDESI